jgi:hypothetical protein
MKRSSVGLLAVLGALGWFVTGSVGAARGYVPSPPYLACFNSSEGDLLVLERSLSPAVNALVAVGTPVTFSGSAGAPVTFAVASSPAMLSSPDIDSGLGALQPGTSSYTFTSIRATATAGVLVYWDASFSSATLTACEGMTPTTYTTQVHTFTVVSPPPPSTMPITPTTTTTTPPAASSRVSVAATDIAVQRGGVSLVKLECLGSASCHGQITLSAKIATKAKGKKRSARTVRIGTASFSIAGDETKTVKVNLDAAGRALLSADHGRCSASLAILELAPSPENTQTKTVQLVLQKVGKGK